MSDLISRQAILKHIEKIRQSVQMMDDTRRASVTMNGMYLCEKVVRNQPSAQPETATITIGRTKGGVAMWYECGACGEPINQKDCYCRNCGRKLKYE